MIQAYAGGRLLDLGCGMAPLYLVYKDYVREITCVDWADSHSPSPFADICADINCSLPFGDGVFDTVLVSDVFEHVYNPDLLWAEIFRVLKSGGHVLAGIPFFYNLHEEPHDYFRYTEFAIRHFCNKHGLKLLSLESTGGSPEVLVNFIVKHLGFSKTLSLFVGISGSFLMSLFLVRKISEKTRNKFPLGYSIVAQKK